MHKQAHSHDSQKKPCGHSSILRQMQLQLIESHNQFGGHFTQSPQTHSQAFGSKKQLLGQIIGGQSHAHNFSENGKPGGHPTAYVAHSQHNVMEFNEKGGRHSSKEGTAQIQIGSTGIYSRTSLTLPKLQSEGATDWSVTNSLEASARLLFS